MTGPNEEVAASLDQLLVQAAKGPLQKLFPGTAGVKFVGALGRQPEKVATRLRGLGGELAKVAVGRSEREAPRGDRRFVDKAWTQNPVLRRSMQAYLAASDTATGFLEDADLEWRDAERMRFAVSNVIDALSPSNNPFLSPMAWKAVVDSGGANLVRGPINLIRDLAAAPRVPTMVEKSAYTVGDDLAATPGAVIYRSEILELIQYAPVTDTVRETPMLIVPPTINKYYVLDLAPGRSLVEYFLQQGQQVFMVSWRNPEAEHRDWGFDAYARAIIEAFDVVLRITRAPSAHIMAACSGGILASLAAARYAVKGKLDRLATLSLLVTMIDQKQSGTAGALVDEKGAKAAVAKSGRKGYLDGRSLAELFAWLRPNDLIWNYWVSNYLEGKPPPKFDILFWNADTTRMSAGLHRDFVDAAMDNKFAVPGAVKVLGESVDLSTIDVDSYVVAGSADHICPWTNCYRSSQLLGGKVRFVLSSNGHIAALVNPPTNPKSSYQVADDNSLPPAEWRQAAPKQAGSWWVDYMSWIGERSGGTLPAPEQLGDDQFTALEAAPGRYIFHA